MERERDREKNPASRRKALKDREKKGRNKDKRTKRVHQGREREGNAGRRGEVVIIAQTAS